MNTGQEQKEFAISKGQVPAAGTSMADAGTKLKKKKKTMVGQTQPMLPSLSVLSPECYSLMHPNCFCFSDHCSLILLFFASKTGISF